MTGCDLINDALLLELIMAPMYLVRNDVSDPRNLGTSPSADDDG